MQQVGRPLGSQNTCFPRAGPLARPVTRIVRHHESTRLGPSYGLPVAVNHQEFNHSCLLPPRHRGDPQAASALSCSDPCSKRRLMNSSSSSGSRCAPAAAEAIAPIAAEPGAASPPGPTSISYKHAPSNDRPRSNDSIAEGGPMGSTAEAPNSAASTSEAVGRAIAPATAAPSLWTPPKPAIWLPKGRAALARASPARFLSSPGTSGAGEGPSTSCAAASSAVQSPSASVTTATTPSSSSGSTMKRLTNVFMASAETRGLKQHMEDTHVIAALDPQAGVQPVRGPVMPQRQVSLAAVFDGHAGRATAAFAAQHMPKLLHNTLSSQHQRTGGRPRGDPTRAALLATFQGFDNWWNDARCDPSITEHGWDESGATAVVGLVSGGHLFVANAGDSVALLMGSGGSQRLSVEHRVHNPEEAERVVEAGGRLVVFTPGGAPRLMGNSSQTRYKGLMVTRALGDFAFKHPEALLSVEPHVATEALEPDDQLVLLATDGVTDVLSDLAIQEVAMKALEQTKHHTNDGSALAKAASFAVANAAIEYGSRDNITTLAMLLDWDQEFV